MTLIISWIGVDCKKEGNKIASLYIASDSRYSWGNQGNFDNGIKVFGCSNSPEIFGFCGDVLFPSNLISQLIAQIDNGIFFTENEKIENKCKKIENFISQSIKFYPKIALNQNFTILYGTRIEKDFYLSKYSFNHSKNDFDFEMINLPNISSKVYSGGSGKIEFDENYKHYENTKHNEHGTSRGVYQCLVNTLNNINDPLTGGFPQIIGLYRVKNSILFGSAINEKLYIYSREYVQEINSNNIEWRNENFERVNPETGKILDGAQRQPN